MAVIQELAVALNTSNAGFNKGLDAASARLRKFQGEVERARRPAVGGAAARAGKAGGLIGSLIGVGAGLIGKTVTEQLDLYAKLAKRTGFAADSLVELDIATQFAGGNFATLETTLFRFNKRVGEAIQGNKEWIKGYKTIGTTVGEIVSKGRPFDQFLFVLEKLNVLSRQGGTSLQIATAAAQKIFGREGAEQALNLAQNYQAIAQAQKFIATQPGIIPSQEDFARAERVADNFTRIGERAKGLPRAAFGIFGGILEGITGFLGGGAGLVKQEAKVEDQVTHEKLEQISRTLRGQSGAVAPINVPVAQ